jgi:cation diffusion facilitator CzcD-associated flavoprotein CzcO
MGGRNESEKSHTTSVCHYRRRFGWALHGDPSDWSRPFAGQAEILAYLNYCADKYDIRRHIQFKTTVTSARWQDNQARWHVVTSAGEEIEAHVVVSALGMFNNLVWPTIPGIHDFKASTATTST